MTSLNGVDITPLDGWMVKINNKPSVFGKSTNRRWFRVSEIQSDQKPSLLLTYASTKNSKEPRGSFLLSTVTKIRCSPECIELVTPMRTLRFRGENVMEHRLWEDALERICCKSDQTANFDAETSPKELKPVDTCQDAVESSENPEAIQDQAESPASSEEENEDIREESESSESQAENIVSSIKDDLSSNREIAFSDEEEVASPTHNLGSVQIESPDDLSVSAEDNHQEADPVDVVEANVSSAG
ncbi:unnamed protein product [Albugo candida]|uniref:PH domain-containing protein n=1 Tax=Albugo candida TaxID=65357 RepID=A0A024G5J4_9STRA|nr:unnamed protein product [Albugo candida]|eukprot:CCI42140.1 unnamed protein product [Albugo candida]